MVISKERGLQPSTRTGLGKNFESPKKRKTSYRTRRSAWSVLNPTAQKKRLFEEMTKLFTRPTPGDSPSLRSNKTASCTGVPDGLGDRGSDWEDVDVVPPRMSLPGTDKSENDHTSPKKRIIPSHYEVALYASWNSLLPTLVEELLAYTSATVGLPAHLATTTLQATCSNGSIICAPKSTQILCLYFDHYKTISVISCDCKSVAQVLVRNGLFPTAPSQTRMAISIDLLDFYAALFERSCDAVNAMAAALNSFYCQRGFYLVDTKGEKYKEPFRKGLGYASQWLDQLRAIVARRVDAALQAADDVVQTAKKREQAHYGVPEKESETPTLCPVEGPAGAQSTIECNRFLRDLCPACFGGVSFGRPLLDGGDFQICTDGNFHHRHLVSAGSGVPFHRSRHFIPEDFVEKVGHDIQVARNGPKRYRKFKVPDAAIDECEGSHRAAAGEKKTAHAQDERYDDRGYMSLVCRHDIPIFFANIDTPGEQQKYAVALLLWFFSLVPSKATATVLYDVGCVLERSIELFQLIPSSIASRIQFVTTAMHAYGHQWACQLVYNPRLQRGLGLTDGEGVERVWSRLRNLIPIVRVSSRSRRIWFTDRHLSTLAAESKDDLGLWIARRLRNANSQKKSMDECIREIGIPSFDLKEQWELQKAAQLQNTHQDASRGKEIDLVLSLQGGLDGVGEAIQAATKTLQASSASDKAIATLKALQQSHDRSLKEAESLYIESLNTSRKPIDSLDKLNGMNRDFARMLRLARDLKASIRRRAIGSFFELDRLDQAVGGRNLALGTKLHQQTRKAIAKRKPALMNAIKKYNAYCATLERLYEPSSGLPLPRPLPVCLADLRDNSDLMEEVWTIPHEQVPLWLESADVRTGIRAMLKRDRCSEELDRLKIEAANLSRWFERELTAIEVAVRQPSNMHLMVHLSRRRDRLMHLKFRWASPLISTPALELLTIRACQIAAALTGGSPPAALGQQNANIAELCQDQLAACGLSNDNCDPCSAEIADDVECHDEHDTAPLLLVSDILAENAGESDSPDEDTSTHRNDQMISMVWEEADVTKDIFDIRHHPVPPASKPLHIPRQLGHIFFEAEDIRRLCGANSMLNDSCLNGCAAVLKQMFETDPAVATSSKRCALFTTHDLLRARYNVEDQVIWKMMSPSEYWRKDVWILPIHRSRELHWVLCIAYPRFKTVLLYDSLAGQRSWVNDLKDVSNLFSRLITLARQSGHDPELSIDNWTARPIVTTARQSNGYDCGLWVLAWIASTLRGFGTCADGMTEDTMYQWRQFLATLISALPVANL